MTKKIVYLLLLVCCTGCSTTRPFKTAQGKKLPNSVAQTRRIHINGINQFLTIRGTDQRNPLLLWLHGGPGSTMMPLYMYANAALEQDFTVVYWDQRGSGKSYSSRIPPASMTLEQFIADTHALTQWLKQRFNQDKLLLVGHSWGGLLGMHVIAKHADDYAAFVAVSPGVNWRAGQQLAYQFTLNTAQQKQDTAALAFLTNIGPPINGVYKDEAIAHKQRALVQRYGGEMRQHLPLPHSQLFLRSTEYSLLDLLKAKKIRRLSAPMAQEVFPVLDLKRQIPAVSVPVYFCVGRYDYVSPSELTADYYQSLQAPVKELIWFEESAHYLCLEEAQKFCGLLKKKFAVTKPNTATRSDKK